MTFLNLVTSIPSVRLSHIHTYPQKIHVLNRNKDNKSETRDRVDWSHRGWNLRLNENTLCQCNYSTLEITAAPINSSYTMSWNDFWTSILIFIDSCFHSMKIKCGNKLIIGILLYKLFQPIVYLLDRKTADIKQNGNGKWQR